MSSEVETNIVSVERVKEYTETPTEVTFGGSPQLSCKRDQIKMRDYMDRRVTPPKRVTSPTWGPPPPCKQALNFINV